MWYKILEASLNKPLTKYALWMTEGCSLCLAYVLHQTFRLQLYLHSMKWLRASGITMATAYDLCLERSCHCSIPTHHHGFKSYIININI
jgi:hypothetical protein